jgi:hypothetical protein
MHRRLEIHPRGLLAEVIDRLRGRDQLLIQAGGELPLVVANYPRGSYGFATSLQSALGSTFRSIGPGIREAYRDVLVRVPSLVVVVLRARNRCTCLGHHHIPGTESRLARRLSADIGRRVGEIDIAVEAIRQWEPLPLSGLAVAGGWELVAHPSRAELEYHRFHTALLSIFLHELEHLAHPERSEAEIRLRSNEFYLAAVREFVAAEYGATFGIEA